MIEKTSVENISGFWYDLSGTDIMFSEYVPEIYKQLEGLYSEV